MSRVTIKRVVEATRRIIANKRDAFYIIDGVTGEGKSTLFIHIGTGVDPKFRKTEAGFERCCVYSREELEEKIKTFPPGSVIGVDEGSFTFFKRDYMDKGQKDLLKLLDVCRRNRICFIVCIPSMLAGVDTYLLKTGRVKARFWIPKRGRFIMFKPARKAFSYDPWNQKYNEKAEMKSHVRYHRDNYVGKGIFPPLPDRVYQMYDAVKVRKSNVQNTEEAEASKTKKDFIIESYLKGLDNEANATQNEVTIRYIRKVIKRYKEEHGVTTKGHIDNSAGFEDEGAESS